MGATIDVCPLFFQSSFDIKYNNSLVINYIPIITGIDIVI